MHKEYQRLSLQPFLVHWSRSDCTWYSSPRKKAVVGYFFFWVLVFNGDFFFIESCQAESRSQLMALGVLLGLRLNQLLGSIHIRNKLALADMLPGARSPHLVGVSTALTLSVLVCALGVQAGIELAGGLNMCKLASFGLTVGSIAADWHTRVLEVTGGVGAVREEPTHGLGLVGGSYCW